MNFALGNVSTNDYEPMTDDDFDSPKMEDDLPSIEFIDEKITDAQAQSVIDNTDKYFKKVCTWSHEVIRTLEHFLNKGVDRYKKIYVIDGLNETCRVRARMKTRYGAPHGRFECHKKGCPCRFEDIIRDQSRKYSNAILLVVTKNPNYKTNDNWYESMLRLSNLPNVIMFPMTMDSMEITPDEFECKDSYRDFLDDQKKRKQRDHDDLGVLLLARILQSEYGSDRCSIVSEDYFRDKKIVANVSPPYMFNIVKDNQVLFKEKVDPLIINSFTPCKCDYWACLQKNASFEPVLVY